MKIGYSIVLSEHVEAKDVDYGDISDFKIVCPICHEVVHKVERGDQHFLSHKHRTPGESAECELRVSSFTRQQLDTLDAVSRGQTLEAFFANLPDMIDAVMPRDRRGVPDWREIAKTYTWKPAARRMRDGCREFLSRNMTDRDIENKINAGLTGNSKDSDVRSRSRLNQHLQRRAATDMFRTIMTPTGKIGFNQLYWAAWCATWIQLDATPDDDMGPPNMGYMHVDSMRPAMIAHLSQIADPKVDLDRLVKRAKKQMLWSMVQGTREVGMSVNGAVENQICYGILAILANIDYMSMAGRGGVEIQSKAT